MAKATERRTKSVKRKAPPPKPARERDNRPGPKNEPASGVTMRSGTKQERAVALLRSKDGASISALMKATGWQQHSVRGFLAGVVRKRLGLPLESAKVNGSRVYRIVSPGGAKPKAATEQQASSSA